MIDNLIRAATCRVSCGDEFGTGYLITDRNVLTARHCVTAAIESRSEIELTFFGPEGDISVPATIVAQSEDMDACILSVPEPLGRPPIPLNAAMPREGNDWRSFGYPSGKTAIGHRVFGIISHLLDAPKLKMDIDLTVDPSIALHSYGGLSGAAVVSENASRGMIRLKLDGTLGAISLQRLGGFLAENGVQIPQPDADEAASAERRGRLADRSVFQESLEQMIARNPGDYVFLEGAHGIGKTIFCNEFETRGPSAVHPGNIQPCDTRPRSRGDLSCATRDIFRLAIDGSIYLDNWKDFPQGGAELRNFGPRDFSVA